MKTNCPWRHWTLSENKRLAPAHALPGAAPEPGGPSWVWQESRRVARSSDQRSSSAGSRLWTKSIVDGGTRIDSSARTGGAVWMETVADVAPAATAGLEPESPSQATWGKWAEDAGRSRGLVPSLGEINVDWVRARTEASGIRLGIAKRAPTPTFVTPIPPGLSAGTPMEFAWSIVSEDGKADKRWPFAWRDGHKSIDERSTLARRGACKAISCAVGDKCKISLSSVAEALLAWLVRLVLLGCVGWLARVAGRDWLDALECWIVCLLAELNFELAREGGSTFA